MNKLELLETRKSLLSQASNIVNRCKNEKRELLKVEDTEFQKLINKISKIDDEINENKNQNNTNMKARTFLRNLKNTNDENQNSLRNELRKYGLQVADNEYIMRAGSPTNGDQIIPVEAGNVEEQMAEISFISSMGGNAVQVPASFVIPTLDGMSLSWEEEDGKEDHFDSSPSGAIFLRSCEIRSTSRIHGQAATTRDRNVSQIHRISNYYPGI